MKKKYIPNSFRGKIASNSAIDENIARIVEFDRRYQQAQSAHDHMSMLTLASWAQQRGMTLGHKAQIAALEMAPITLGDQNG